MVKQTKKQKTALRATLAKEILKLNLRINTMERKLELAKSELRAYESAMEWHDTQQFEEFAGIAKNNQ